MSLDQMNQLRVQVKVHDKIDLPYDLSNCIRHDLWYYGIPGEDFVIYYRKIFWYDDILFVRNIKKCKPEILATKFVAKKPLRARGSLGELVSSINMIMDIERGIIRVHAGCVSDENVTILMPASPNIGKTFTVLYFLKKGFGYLADDTISIDINGYAYATPFPSAVDTHVLERIKMPWWKTWEIKIRTFFVKKVPGGTKILKPYMLKAWEAIPGTKIVSKAKITHVIILEAGQRGVIKLNEEKAARLIQSINRYSLPRPYYNPVLKAYNMFNPDWLGLRLFEEKEYEILLKVLSSTDNYIVSSTPRKFAELIERIIK